MQIMSQIVIEFEYLNMSLKAEHTTNTREQDGEHITISNNQMYRFIYSSWNLL